MQTLIKIYRMGGVPIIVSADFDFSRFAFDKQFNGTITQIYRVDFFDPSAPRPQPLFAVLPCDPAASTIDLAIASINFKLRFCYLLGQPEMDPNKLGMQGNLLFRGGSLGFFAGLHLDNVRVDVGPGPFPFAGYAETFGALANTSPNPFPVPIDPGPLPGATQGWETFPLDRQIFHSILSLDAGATDGGLLPILTLARDIPAVLDPTGIRRLPDPFAIPVALGSTPGFAQASLRMIQNPNTQAFRDGTGPAVDWTIQVGNFAQGTIADFWQRSVYDRYVGALESVASAEPISFLPRFVSPPGGGPAASTDSQWLLRFPANASHSPSAPGSLMQIGGALEASLSSDACMTWNGTGLPLTATLSPPKSTQPIDPPFLQFSATPVSNSPVPATFRLGSLDLTPSAPPTFGLCIVRFELKGGFWIPRVTLDGSMALANAQPGGQDDPSDPVAEQAAEAVAISTSRYAGFDLLYKQRDPLSVPPVPQPQTFTLTWSESSVAGFNQELTVTLSANPTGPASGNVLVIDPQPLSIALVQLPSLSSAASSTTNQVAQWSNSFPEGPGWRIAAGAGKFQLLLPSQGIGEEMIKDTSNIPDGRVLNFRLTPPAVAALQSTAEAQRYAEPGWNLRRILGVPGQQAPGAILQSLSFEMLYGLTCNVTHPGLKLSEMFSRLGAFAGPLIDSTTGQLDLNLGSGYTQAQSDTFFQLNKDWAARYSQLLSRLGTLELYADETQHNLLLSDGVSCTLRGNAQLEYPAGDQPSNSNAPRQPADGSGLRGGIAWPFDSSNIYETLWGNPNSTAALFSNPRFTALGGSGVQRASFSNGNIIIESETFVGNLASVTVTLRGYIGNLRHPATHVVVYARSVRPSRQFYLEQPLAEARPILRKTAEYVKLTQAARSYPEIGSPNPATGPLFGAEFKTIQINVDSAWGSDLGKGWRVPLWKRDAQPADVYPRPHVVFDLAVDPSTGADSHKCEMVEPDKLYFYTDPSQTSPDTDDWPMVEFVDFCRNNRSRSIDGAGAVKDYTIEPGFGQFTYRVDGDAPQVNVVAQRTKNPISSRLTNVTFMRGGIPAPPNNTQAAAGQAAAGRLQDHLNNILDELANTARAFVPSSSVVTLSQALTTRYSQLTGITGAYATDLASVAALPGNICAKLGSSAANFIDRASSPLASSPLVNQWNGLAAALSKALNGVSVSAAALPGTLKAKLLALVDGGYSSLQSVLSPLLADLGVAGVLKQTLTGVSTQLSGDLTNLQAAISSTALDPPFIEQCRAIVSRLAGDLDVVLGDVEQLLQSVTILFSLQVTGTAASQVAGLRAALADLSASVQQKFQSVADKLAVATPIASDINSAIDQLKALLPPAALINALDTFNQIFGSAGNPNSFAGKLATYRDQLKTAISNVADAAAQSVYLDQIETAIAGIQNDLNQTSFNTLIGRIKTSFQNQISVLCQTVAGALAQAGQNLLGSVLSTFLQNINPDVSQAVGQLESFRDQGLAALDSVVQQARSLVQAGDIAQQAADSAIGMVRAFGAPPAVPNLAFNFPLSAYFFDGNQAVAVTKGLQAAAAEASNAISGLNQLGINLPTAGVFDRLVPEDLSNLTDFDLSDLLPRIAGLDLSKMFDGVGIPASAKDNIHISHKLDPQTLRASLDVTLNFSLPEPATLFSIGPATVTLDGCVFDAQVHIEGGVGQAANRTSRGSITGTWSVDIGGTEVVSFLATSLTFDSAGHLNFDISPDRVQLSGALQFLVTFLQQSGLAGNGFSLNILPTGVQCILDLPFPDCSFGAFGITNLRLGSSFALDVANGFSLNVAANLGRKTAPFTLTIFILGGAGWFEASLVYNITSGQITSDVSIGIVAAASLSISLGPISGGVYIYFGITAEFHSGTSGGGLTIGILLSIEGRVSLLGIIDADILLLLEADYSSEGGLVGRGRLSISIKICWCFTLSISASVEYTFGNASGSRSPQVAHSFAEMLAPAAAVAPPPSGIMPPSGGDVSNYAQSAANRINYLS